MATFRGTIQRYYKQLQKAVIAEEKAILRHYVTLAKWAATNAVAGIIASGPLTISVRQENGYMSSGFVKLSANTISKRLQRVIENHNELFMKEVFALSQEYVPIDKRYAEAKHYKFLDTGRKSIKSQIYTFNNSKDYQSFISQPYSDRTDPNYLVQNKLEPKFVTFERKSGWYEEKEVDYIKDMFRGQGHRVRYNRYYYDKSTETVKTRNKYNLTASGIIDTEMKLKDEPLQSLKNVHYTNTQPSGGYKELKEGGRLYTSDKSDMTIVYTAFDKSRRYSTFNYAAIQHENNLFIHKYGKARFLYKAFTEKRRKWYENIGASKLKKEITNAFK